MDSYKAPAVIDTRNRISSKDISCSVNSPAPGEIYHSSKTFKIIVLSLSAIFLLLAICTIKLPLEFDWFFGSIPYFLGFAFLCFIALLVFAFSLGDQRDGKIYLNKYGKLDIGSPRSYEALKKPAIVRFLGQSHPFRGEGVQNFEYNDGYVTIVTTKGNQISDSLLELTWEYSMTKPKGADDWQIYKYILTDTAGNSVTFYRNNSTFDDKEWDDMNMLLSLCSSVSEKGISKFNRKIMKALETIQDIDFSDINESIGNIVSDKIFEGSNMVIEGVKVKLMNRNKKNKGWKILKKVCNWILLVMVTIYLLAVTIYNVIQLVKYFSGVPENEIEQVMGEYYAESMEETSVANNPDNIFHLSGSIDGKYKIDMTLDFNSRTGSYYYTKYSSDHTLRLVITNASDRRISIEEYNDKNERTGFFDGHITNDEIRGWYTNYQNREMPFFLKVDNPGNNAEGIFTYITGNAVRSQYNGLPAYYYKGDFISGKSKFPVELIFLDGDDEWGVIYKNLQYDTQLEMELTEVLEDRVTFTNYDNDFRVILHKDIEGELSGEAQQGKTVLEVRLVPQSN